MWRRLRLQAMQTRFHSRLTFACPHNENRRNPMASLIIPMVGSTVCRLNLWSARPATVDVRYLILSLKPASTGGGSGFSLFSSCLTVRPWGSHFIAARISSLGFFASRVKTGDSLTKSLSTGTVSKFTFSFTAFKSPASSCLSLGDWLTRWPTIKYESVSTPAWVVRVFISAQIWRKKFGREVSEDDLWL